MHFLSCYSSSINVQERPTKRSPLPNNQLLKAQEKRESNSQSPSNTEYFVFLNESQKHDHKFFGQLAEKEGEREWNSQQMMFSMVNKVAKKRIKRLKENKAHIELLELWKMDKGFIIWSSQTFLSFRFVSSGILSTKSRYNDKLYQSFYTLKITTTWTVLLTHKSLV